MAKTKPPTTVAEAAREYAKLRRKLEKLAQEKSDTQKDHDEMEERLVKLMEAQGITSTKLDRIGTFRAQAEVYANIVKEHEAALFAWLKKNGHGGIIKETVHHGTFKSWFKEELNRQFDKGKDIQFRNQLIDKTGWVRAYDKVKIVFTPDKGKTAKPTVGNRK